MGWFKALGTLSLEERAHEANRLRESTTAVCKDSKCCHTEGKDLLLVAAEARARTKYRRRFRLDKRKMSSLHILPRTSQSAQNLTVLFGFLPHSLKQRLKGSLSGMRHLPALSRKVA